MAELKSVDIVKDEWINNHLLICDLYSLLANLYIVLKLQIGNRNCS